MALLFKDGGGLANHPLSCHPQGVFGSRESKRKGKKMGEKESSGKTPAIIFINGEDLNSACLGGFYSPTPFTNYQNNIVNTITMGAKKEENQKVKKRSQKVKGARSQQCRMNSGCMMNSGSMKEISQPAKFCRLRNFCNPAKFLWCSNFLIFSTLFSFWFLIYNDEFDSDSSCLDRLNNFGINNLQKLQN